MANEVHRKLKVSITDFDFDTSFAEIDSLADGDICWSNNIESATVEDCDEIEIFFSIKTGTSPDEGGTISFWVAKSDDGSGEIRAAGDEITTTDHGTQTVDATVDRIVYSLGSPDYVQPVDSTSDKVYSGSFTVPYVGLDWNLFIRNSTGAALNGTSSPHKVRYRGWVLEIQ